MVYQVPPAYPLWCWRNKTSTNFLTGETPLTTTLYIYSVYVRVCSGRLAIIPTNLACVLFGPAIAT